ncbi:DUF6480 family protein [Streptomyces aureocirculatus]|uniref:DUF6480 family protein n=1 Tax=Streptomyces aureocirculatus TaxID=67275 RepID=UPI0004C6BF25|nr:DUF6480 family protein [Streptomyces aureocirculatus]
MSETNGKNPDPDPLRTPGLDPGGGVPPGETPPAEGSISGAGPDESHNPTTGWAKAPLIIILALVVLVAVGLIGYAVSL